VLQPATPRQPAQPGTARSPSTGTWPTPGPAARTPDRRSLTPRIAHRHGVAANEPAGPVVAIGVPGAATASSHGNPERLSTNAETRQEHDYPSAAHRRSYARRTGAERGFATAKDPATNDITRGWCRLMGLAPLMLYTTTLLIARNQRILAALNTRQQENARRAAQGLPPKTRRRRRKTLTMLATAPH
jgi:hypothetical protein